MKGYVIQQKFADAKLTISDIQGKKFERLLELLLKHNKDYDLTGIINPEEIVIKHFIDSALVSSLTSIRGTLLDVATGPGFPGIPLKIMNEDQEIILAEPRHRRVTFMKIVLAELGLKGIEIFPHMVNEYTNLTADCVITRAFEEMSSTLLRVNHLIPENGRVLFMKGPNAADEIRTITPFALEHYRLESALPYELPGTPHQRTLVTFCKISSFASRVYFIPRDGSESIGRAITSPDNRLFREFRRSAKGELIKKEKRVIVAGKKIVADIITAGKIPWNALILPDDYRETDPLFMEHLDRARDVSGLFVLKKGLFGELDSFNTGGPLLEVSLPATAPVTDFTGAGEGPVLVLPFQDPVNSGAVTRTALALGISEIIIAAGGANPFHPKSIRASAGAVFLATFFQGGSIEDIAASAKERGYVTVPLDGDGTPIDQANLPLRSMIIPGIEGPGLPESLKNESVAIPIAPEIESLNAASAVSILLWEIKRRYSPSNSQR